MVQSGLDVLLSQSSEILHGKKVGIVTHAAAIDRNLRSSIEAIGTIPEIQILKIFGPEHGLHGQAQDLIGVADQEAKGVQTQVVSLYGKNFESLKPTTEQLQDLDFLVIDLQDVGTRFYTFQATMKYSLEVALPMGLDVIVLDRPNPIGGLQVEGPGVCQGFESFVGVHSIAVRHAMTIGELACLYRKHIAVQNPNAKLGQLHIVACQNWETDRYFDECKLPWVLPSPNMPTLQTAIVYPGQCLLEGTNLSEGRGTTRPFEICGAPWIDAIGLSQRMNQLDLPGVKFRPVWFRPTFQKHAGIDCGGVQIHVLDAKSYAPVRTSLALLIQMRNESPEKFAWRSEIYEFVSDPIAIDLLFGSNKERLAIEQGRTWEQIAESWTAQEEAFRDQSKEHWIYPR